MILFNSKYKRQWINVIFFCIIITILMRCLKIYSVCVFGAKLEKFEINLAFIPVDKPHTYEHCIS